MGTESSHRICLVGAGFISEVHAEVLREVAGASVVAICDTDLERARQVAERFEVPGVFSSVDEALAGDAFDCAHVLVPPDHHVAVARQLLGAGIRTFVEKPLGISEEECRSLLGDAEEHGARLGVNHNALFLPAFLKLRREIAEHSLGRLQHLALIRNMPDAGLPPASHWMLRRPQNMMYEAAVHPLSQIYDLAGPLLSAESQVSGRRDLGPDQHFFDTWQISLVCERATAQLLFTCGGSYPTWHLVAVCEDGMMTADLELNRFAALDQTALPGYFEPLHLMKTQAPGEVRQGLGGFGRQAASLLGLAPSADPFLTSMRNSITAYYRGAPEGWPTVDGEAGARVVEMCEAAARPVATDAEPPRPSTSPRSADRKKGKCDAVLLGGTGFIGSSLLGQMVEAGMTVRVMARTTTGLPALFSGSQVETVQGDIADPSAVSDAVEGAGRVVYLAHGGNFEWEGLESGMIRPAASVAEACVRSGAERLIYTGSIASLDLGDPAEVITGSTPNDPQIPGQLAPYGWGKAKSEEVLESFSADQTLPLCIVRPGIVLGAGGLRFHPGFGQWRAEIHCLGWNAGTNPMPLVLVSDVAAAIMLSLDSETALGRTYNLVGDVRLSAREYIETLKREIERPLVFHPKHPAQHQAADLTKWGVKLLAGRRGMPLPSYRWTKSMGCAAQFDCSDVKTDLGWAPMQDRDQFVEQAIGVHRPPAVRGEIA